jgi:hypothetical protein
MESMFSVLFQDGVSTVYSEYYRPENKEKVDNVINDIFEVFFRKIKPYLVLVITVLCISIVMNCVQFYYYIRVFLKQSTNNVSKAQVIKDIFD